MAVALRVAGAVAVFARHAMGGGFEYDFAKAPQAAPPGPPAFLVQPAGVPVTVTQDNVAMFADSMFWVGDKLALGMSDQPDAYYPAGNTGKLMWSADTVHWSAATEAAGGPMWIPKTALPSTENSSLVLAYQLRRFGPENYTHAYVHAQRIVSSSGALTQTEYINSTFIFPPTHLLAPMTSCAPMCGAGFTGPVSTLFFWTTNGNVIQLDSGEMLASLYGTYKSDATPTSTVKDLVANFSLAVSTSSDGGLTWHWRSTVQHQRGPSYCHNPNENAVVKLSSGKLLVTWRSAPAPGVGGNGAPLCFAVSTNANAEAWTLPMPLPGAVGAPGPWVPSGWAKPGPWGVMPRLIRLDAEGLLVLTTGRGGLMMWVADDPPNVWHPFSIATAHNNLSSPALRYGCGKMAAEYNGWCAGAGGGYDDNGNSGSVRSTCYTGLAAMPDGRGVVVSYDQDGGNKALNPQHGMIVFSMRFLIKRMHNSITRVAVKNDEFSTTVTSVEGVGGSSWKDCGDGELAIGDGPLTACITKSTTAIASVTFGGWTQRLSAATQLFGGCGPSGAPTVLVSSSAVVSLRRSLACSPSKYHTDSGLTATVTDTFRVILLPSPALEWNTSVDSTSERYWTTELNDVLEIPLNGTRIWTAASDGSRLESDHSSLDPVSLAEYKGRTYYGRDMWSSNGRGTVMLCSPAGGASCPGHRYPTIATVEQELLMGPTPPSPPPDWFEGQNMVACGYPECCGDPNATPGCHKPSKYPLLLLGNISTGVKTAADCEKLCLGKPGCNVWQIGSPKRGSACQSVQGMTVWTPLASSGGRVAGCKLSAVSGCGKTPPRPPSPSPPHPKPSPSPPSRHHGQSRTTSLPIISLLFSASDTVPPHGLSLVQNLNNFPNNAYLDSDGGALNWTRQWFRFGNGTAPIQLQRYLVPHEDDFRPGLGFLVRSQAASFEVHPSVNHSLIDGAGSFADYRGEQDKRPFSTALGADGYSEKLKKMNYQVNWMTTANNGESHGTWMPFNLSTGEPFTDGWTSCMGIPNFTAYFTPENRGGQAKNRAAYQYPTPCTHQTYSSLSSWFSDMASFGFSTMLYGNYWEYGWSCDGGRGNRAGSNNDCDTGFGMPAGIKTSTPLPFCDPLPHCEPREAGFPHDDPEAPAQRACKLRLLCDTNLYMRRNLLNSILRPWSDANGRLNEANMSDSVIKSGMEGAVLQDVGMPEYLAYQVKMVNLAMEKFPQTAGVAFDGTGWQGRINLHADDLRSYVELHEYGETGGPFVRPGKPIHTQVSSKKSAQEAIGNALHAKGKAHFWNPYAPRADFMMHTDGVFSEDSYMDERMHLHGLLGVGGKPILTWNPGCESWPSSQCGRYRDSANNEQLLQRLLYWGVQPMVPFARNDHAITRFVAEHGNDTKTFEDYGPLFRALRGRRWVYTAHAAVPLANNSGSAAINIFSRVTGNKPATEELVLTVSLATPGTKLAIALRGVSKAATTASLQLLVPGGNLDDDASATLQRQDSSGTSKLEITIGSRPAAVVILPGRIL